MPRPLVIVHRFPGTAARCAELAGLGAGGFELDVQLRRPGPAVDVVVTHYLPFLQVPGWLEHDGRRFRWRAGARPDPSLTEALDRLPPGVLATLDPKELRTGRRHALAEAVAGQLAADPRRRDRIVVTTSGAAEIEVYAAAGLSVWRTLGAARDVDEVAERGAGTAAGVAVRHTLLTAANLARLRRHVATVAAWTVDDVGTAIRLADLGVDAVTTDNPAVITALGALPA